MSRRSFPWLLIGLLAGCASDRITFGPSLDPVVDADLSADADKQMVVVPFVTTRKIESDRKSRSYYGDGRGPRSWGHCVVELDESNKASVKAQVKAVVPESGLPARLKESSRIVVYVHGYNIGFEKGCRRAARLQSQLGVEGQLLLYSWPADGNYLNYLRDVADLDWSNPVLIETLTELGARLGHQNLDLIGHSLGARGLVRAMAEMHADGQPPFATLTLIAPDMDRELFVRELGTLQQMASRVTVYVSANDKALSVSRRANGYPRAGQAIAGLDYPGIDLVDVSEMEVGGFSGHIYHLRTAAVVEDLRRVLRISDGEAQFKRVSAGPAYHLIPVTEP